MATLFSSPEHAALYVKYRPEYPASVYDKILQVLDDGDSDDKKTRHLAVDIGCGSGQTTRALTGCFETVLGLDTSEAQLREARNLCSGVTNVSFKCETADRLDEIVDRESVDLVTVATALHFFGSKDFFEKCLSVLRKGGAVAAYCYDFKIKEFDNEEAIRLFEEFFRDYLLRHFDERVKHVFNKYETLLSILAEVFPKTERWSHTVVEKRSLKQISGFIQSMSAYRSYREQNPNSEDPIQPFMKRLKAAYGIESEDDEQILNLPMEYFMIIGKKS